jgi:hypothetical protein
MRNIDDHSPSHRAQRSVESFSNSGNTLKRSDQILADVACNSSEPGECS